MITTCPTCGKNVNPEDIFCAQCGTKLLDRNCPVHTNQKIRIYVLSFLVAPFGLYWFFKFYNDDNPYKKGVAKNVLWITVIAVVFMIISGIYTISLYTKLLNSYMSNATLYGF